VGGPNRGDDFHATTTKALDPLADSTTTGTATENTTKALDPLADSTTTGTATENTTKALDPLAVAEQDILVARCRSRLG
jgi:hypothetical protein